MKICLISGNLGSYDVPQPYPALNVPDGVTVDVFRHSDETLPPRPLAMTSRLLAGVPKWWGFQIHTGYGAYIWLDASVTPTPDAVPWFLDHLGDADIAVFQHPERRTVRDEYEFMVKRMQRPGETYLNSRYKGEYLREQYEYIASDDAYEDDALFASTAFMYRPTAAIQAAFVSVWAMKSRWLTHDQLAFPYALAKAECVVNVIPDNYLKCPALQFTRAKRR